VDVRIAAQPSDRVGEVKPTRDGQGVHRRVVDHDLGNMVANLGPDQA
jgi:hypothetical protein